MVANQQLQAMLSQLDHPGIQGVFTMLIPTKINPTTPNSGVFSAASRTTDPPEVEGSLFSQ